ncbi:CPBP family intramembrane glutamic endopeptidase [Salimicrobium humidisoli]|uniref:CPBP family intramembrane metalloprotease n=1 Tax=Salimicrobium humidisoli TaxID=2029857 RepID=A0ABX4HRM2_9BACI|nr:CPBP family intramembrane glutamic endopeptidase [Salimicrobium humidisoli]PBB05484.1 CPBP family intramembrane metalloprotease [Salimicrobium humidisoli]
MDNKEIIKQMSSKELMKHVLITQGLLMVIALAVSSVFLDFREHWTVQWGFDIKDWIIYAVIPATLIVGFDGIIMKTLPEDHYDDGGINRKLFEGLPVPAILLLTAVIAFSEEMLFRGVLQPLTGFVPASLLFAFVHFRYLSRPLLFTGVLIISFLFGFIYEQTQALTYVVSAHFFVDFTLALILKSKSSE